MKTFQLTLFGLLFIFLVSCKKESLPNEIKTVKDAYMVIIGEWEWEKTITIDKVNQATNIVTPQTENKNIRRTFKKNLQSSEVEIINKDSSHKDYTYNITINDSEGDGHNATFFLTSTDINTNEVSRSWIKFKDKNTFIFYHGSLPFETYFIRKSL